MKEDVSNPNIEWKKNNSEPSERLTLRVNHKEAAVYSAAKKNVLKAPRVSAAENLPKGLKKIRKKVRNIDVSSEYDDDEEEEFQYVPDSLEQLNQANSLMNALNEEEKKLLHHQEELQNMNMQRMAGKMEALATAAHMAKQAGLNGFEQKAIVKNQQSNEPLENIAKQAVGDMLSQKEKTVIKKIPEGKVIQTLRGVKRVKDAGGTKALEGLSLDALIKAGEKNLSDEDLAKIAAKENNELAKKILKKSGQDVKKKRKKEMPDKIKSNKKGLVRRNLSLNNLHDR